MHSSATGPAHRHALPLQWRIVLVVFALVLPVCWIGAGMILHAARQQRIDRVFESALSEHTMLRESIRTYADSYLITAQGAAYAADDMVSGAVAAYARYYTKEKTALRVLSGAGTVLYRSSPADSVLSGLDAPGEDQLRYLLRQDAGATYVCVSSRLAVAGGDYQLDSVEDISAIVRDDVLLARRIAVLLTAALALLLAALSLLLRSMLTPLSALSEKAREIARGRYDQRVRARHMDEVGRLADDFNNMATAIEEKIDALGKTARAHALFAANMAHELKTPITSIIGYSDLAQRLDIEPDRLQRMMAYINTEAKRLNALSEKLLSLYDLAERRVAQRAPVRVDRMLAHVRRALGPMLSAHSQRLSVQCGGVATLLADEALLISALINLCQNAGKASPDGAAIQIVICATEDGGSRIDVIDEGCGIAADDLLRVREPFYMADKTRSHAQEGIGLGLALCDAIMRAHGGGIEISSSPGKGTRVRVSLPG